MSRVLLMTAFLLACNIELPAFQASQSPAACLNQPPRERPYSRSRLLDVIKNQTPARAEYLIRTCGVGVALTRDLERDLKDTGAHENVIAAVREALNQA